MAKTQLELMFNEQTRVARLQLVATPEGKPPTIDQDVIDALDHHCRSLIRQGAVVLVLESGSGKYFNVGGNIESLGDLDHYTIEAWVRRGHEVFQQLAALPMPVIAVVNGYCLGGGLELALACDFILASSDARFAMPEASLGLVPGWGGSFRLTQKVGRWFAKRMILTGEKINAQDAARAGLVDILVDSPTDVEKRLEELIDSILRLNPLAVRSAKQLCDNIVPKTRWSEAADCEAEASMHMMRSTDTQERIASFFTARH